MAEIRDRNQPHQVHVRPQYRYDNPAGVGYGGGGKNYHSGGPSATQILAVLTLLPVGGSLLALSGLTLAGTVIGLLVATPVFLLFSPILVPAVIAISMAVTGFLSSGAFGLTGLSSLNYVLNRLRYATGTEQMDLEEARKRMQERVQDMAGYVGAKTKEVGQKIESKANEAQVTTASART